MSNFINRLAAYFDRKGDTFGEWYTRALIGFFVLSCIAGFAAGFMFDLWMGTIRQWVGQL